MRSVLSLTLPVLVLFAATAVAAGDIAVVRGTLTERLDPDREGRGIPKYLKNVTTCLDRMGVGYDLLTDEDVCAGKLAGYKLTILPYHAQRTDEWTQAVVAYIEAGGKVFAFYSIDEPVAALLGVRTTSHFRQKKAGDLAAIRFKPGIARGLPDSAKQMSWGTRVVEPVGKGRVLAMWLDGEGKDTGMPAVVISPNGLYMAHVLLGEDLPAKARFLFACTAHFLPDLWAAAAAGRIAQIGKAASFTSLAELRKRFDAEAKRRKLPADTSELLAKAEGKAAQARSLAKEKKFEQALAAADAAIAASGQVYYRLVPTRQGECRGVWMPREIWTTWDEAMKNLKENGFNAAFPVMCSGYSANYESAILPPSDVMKRSGDQLKLCLAAARKHGIQVHVWRVNWRAPRATDEQGKTLEAEGRLQVGVNGEKDDGHDARWLCPSHPANQKLELDAMLEIVKKYRPDGIHFDYIRYPNSRFCYCEGCRKRFEAILGKAVANWPKDVRKGGPHFEAFDDWRRDQITRTVAAVSEGARKIDPHVKISAAVFRDWAAHRRSVGQDWKLWCEKGYLDFVCPMDYTDDPKRFRKDVAAQVDWVAGAVPLYPGIGAFSSSSRFPDASHLLQQIEIARGLGGDGFLIFHYNEDLATRFLPELRRGATAKDTFLPHDAPKITFAFPDPVIPSRPRGYAVDEEIRVKMTFAKDVMGRVQLERADGQSIKALDAILAEDKRERSPRIMVPEGLSRIAVYGQAAGAGGKPVQCVRRSAPIIGLSEEHVEEHELRTGPPRVPPGDGMRVGVVDGGFGSTSILKALKLETKMRVFPLYNFIPESVAACDVIVLPQLKDPARLDDAVRKRLREFVLKGGGLVVTHDAVGYRNHPALFPEVAVKGVTHPKATDCKLVAEHEIAKGVKAPDGFRHSYFDRVLVQPGAKGSVVVTDADGKAIVVAGRAEAGRYVADGMATGLGPKNEDVPLKDPEKQLLVNMVRWAGSK